MSLKTFLIRKMLASKLQGVPKDQQDKIFAAIEKNPDLFKKIAEEIQEKVKGGKDEMAAAMEVIPRYQHELQSLM